MKNMRIVTFIAVMIIVGKLGTFIRDIILTYYYGASSVSDAFLVSISVPTVLISGIGMAIFTSYIPLYSDLKINNSGYIKKFNSNLLSCVFILSFVILLVYHIFSEQIIRLFAVGFDKTTFEFTLYFSNIMTFSMIFIGVSYIFQGYLQANGLFYLVAACALPLQACIILGIIISNKIGIIAIPFSVLIGYTLYIPYFGIPCYKKGFRYVFTLDVHDEYLKNMLIVMMPIFIGQIFSEINSVVDKSVASLLDTGGVTALDYSFKIVALLFGVISTPISTFIYPKVSEFVTIGMEKEIRDILRDVLRVTSIILIPVTIGLIVLARPIIEVFYYHGSFTENSVVITAQSVVAYALCAIPIGLRVVCEKIFYAKKNTRTPMINSAIGILVNIVLDILLVRDLKHVGIALATTASSFVTFLLFYLSLRRMIGDIGTKNLVLTITKSFVASGFMGITLMLLNNIINSNSNIALIIFDVFLGALIYLSCLLVLGEDIVFKISKSKTIFR